MKDIPARCECWNTIRDLITLLVVTEKRDISDERKRMDLEWDMISTLIIENPALSRVLYNTIEIVEEIGPELYQVAVELLASAACERDRGDDAWKIYPLK